MIPIGFYNTGSICWLNSLLQALCACDTFVKAVCEASQTGSATLVILKLMFNDRANWSSYSAKILAALAMDLKETQPENYKILCDGNQQSASEGFTLLIDSLKSLTIKKIFFHYVEQKIFNKNLEELSCNKLLLNFFTVFNEDRLMQIGLSEYILSEHEELNDGEKIKTIKLRYAPAVIVILLNRYKRKNPNIKLPDSFCLPYKDGKHSMQYTRIADIQHSGSLNGGHYTAKVKVKDEKNKLFMCNDSSVYEISDMTTNSNTYLTFYQFSGNLLDHISGG